MQSFLVRRLVVLLLGLLLLGGLATPHVTARTALPHAGFASARHHAATAYGYDAAARNSSATSDECGFGGSAIRVALSAATTCWGEYSPAAIVFIAADEGASVAERDAAACGCESFTPDTNVVMADGSAKPLDQVNVGDKVEATDPASGETSAQTVTKVWINHDTDLTDVRIKTDGGTSTIHATQHHLYWDSTRHAWTEADELAAGDRLRTSDGRLATVASTAIVGGTADMRDLTVDTSHDFYVVTTIADVLVHNCPVERNTPYGNNGEPPRGLIAIGVPMEECHRTAKLHCSVLNGQSVTIHLLS